MTNLSKINLANFIENEKKHLHSMNVGINWDLPIWNTSNWIPHRGLGQVLSFNQHVPGKKKTDLLPAEFTEFCKAMIVNIQRTKRIGYVATHKYLLECKRLYSVMKERSETSPTQITRWHFEQCIKLLIESNHKTVYDAACNLHVIASIIDTKLLTSSEIEFKHSVKRSSSRHDYVPISELGSDFVRKNDEKLPSYEALQAYAICTNNPVDESEEVILRTIDLLIAMGQRINEVAMLPHDCWVEQVIHSKKGIPVKDGHGKEIIKTGIIYYAEKNFESRVHWLADQDIVFAKRAVERLKILTEPVRRVAIFQEENPNRLWNIEKDVELTDNEVKQYINTTSSFEIFRRLKALGVNPVKKLSGKNGCYSNPNKPYNIINVYKAGEIEDAFLKKNTYSHDQLKVRSANGVKVILKTSDLLCIRFFGTTNLRLSKTTLFPRRVSIIDVNSALGSNEKVLSIFDKRGFKESDGSRISMTSHQPRHWRNTLYELAGMTNVQQALALGRHNLDQNATYQHTSILDRTKSHKEFLSFNSPLEKIQFLHNGIREKKIQGEITQLYHKLKIEKGKELAESFLATHANSIHLTPFGGCTHDFSQAPCPKHLQCWNGCCHLHRTNTPGESERIVEQIELSKLALDAMKKDSDGEYGADLWVSDLQNKIENMQKALDLKPDDNPLKVFPDGKPVTLDISQRKGSSVSEK